MNYKVVYFTRTGTSKRVAEKIAKKLSSEAIEITDNVNWKGILGFMKGGFYASTNRSVTINIPKSLDDTAELIVVTPLWASKVAPAIKTFMKTKALDKIHLVVCSGGSKIKDRSGYQSVTDIVGNEKNEEESVNRFVDSLV